MTQVDPEHLAVATITRAQTDGWWGAQTALYTTIYPEETDTQAVGPLDNF